MLSRPYLRALKFVFILKCHFTKFYILQIPTFNLMLIFNHREYLLFYQVFILTVIQLTGKEQFDDVFRVQPWVIVIMNKINGAVIMCFSFLIYFVW